MTHQLTGSNATVSSSFVPVCREDHAYLGRIPQNGSVRLSMWFTDPDFLTSNCYVWCEEKAKKPQMKYKVSPIQNMFVSLGAGFFNQVVNVNMTSDMQAVAFED